MLSQPNVFLIGPMGSGKSAVGRHLARLLRFSFHDSDADIEARTGVDIAFIFEKEGEAGFRLRERESIERLTRLTGVVIATGGGAVIHVDNRRMLAERGAVVYLETSIGQRKAAAALLKAAGQSYSAAIESYNDGVRTLLDVTNAQRILAQARLADVTARTQVLITLSDLAYAAGDSVEPRTRRTGP